DAPATERRLELLLRLRPAGDRLARTRNMLAASHTTEVATRFGRGPLLGGYLKPRQPCASRDADACVERAADPLNSGRIDAKPCSDPAHALCASRLVQSLTDSFLQRRGYRRPTKTLPLAPGPRKPGADAFLNHGALELGKYAHHLKHRLACRRLTSSPSELS